MWVVCLCPLAKIFQPEHHSLLIKKPELIFDETMPFRIRVQRSHGDCWFDYNKPINFSPNPRKEEDILAFQEWITGGDDCDRVPETDPYGLVQLKLPEDAVNSISALLSMPNLSEDAIAKAQEANNATLREQISKANQDAKDASYRRVTRHIKKTYDGLQKQYKLNDEAKIGHYEPSTVEFLCAYALKAEETKLQDDRKKLTDQFKQLMSGAF